MTYNIDIPDEYWEHIKKQEDPDNWIRTALAMQIMQDDKLSERRSCVSCIHRNVCGMHTAAEKFDHACIFYEL